MLIAILITVGFSASAQYTTQVQVNENVVPKVVVMTFKKQYDNPLVYKWNTTHISYWYSDYSDGWYNNWYGPRTVVMHSYQASNYFEVFFTKDPGEISIAIYNRYGFWYETRTRLTGLPPAVLEGLSKTKYAEWKRSTNKERIEAAGWPDDVYRFKVTKGIQSQIIRLDSKGNLVQERKMEYQD
mgnify:CR=1 FL=1